ncbi:hypothetical protein CSB95_6570 [Pseudomonas aeruginosa]|nr:hypothetical protein HMPREF3150_05752 [Pseudomonas aeruginosa]PRW18422.1 hypothetical protein CSB95_6570 [Pseudomonas aeruginosa]PRW30623.1 hypothetical protein CSB96_1529 [Pseudomonas aeruginosa]RCG92397.1 hypothetical protein CSB89_0102 [Pseudomonas aeruginosa]
MESVIEPSERNGRLPNRLYKSPEIDRQFAFYSTPRQTKIQPPPDKISAGACAAGQP